MRPVSSAYKTAIDGAERQVWCRVHVDLAGNFVDKGASASASSVAHAQATPAAQAIDSYAQPRRKWAAAGFLYLDGTYYPLPADGKEQAGWWGGKESDPNYGRLWQKLAASFSRPSVAYLSDGTQVASGVPRYEPGRFGQAILIEEGTTNLLDATNSQGFTSPVNITVTNGATYTVSMTGSGSISLSGAGTGTVTASSPVTFTASGTTLTLTPTGSTGRVQVEAKPYKTTWQIGGTTHSAESLTIPTAGVLSPQEGTVECWVKLGANPVGLPSSNIPFIFHPTGATGGANDLILYIGSDGHARLQFGDGATSWTIVGTTVLQNNVWYYLAASWGPSGAKLYVNGTLEASSTTVPAPIFIANAYVGRQANLAQRYLNGLIDDLRISSRARTDEEIAAAYQAGTLTWDADTTCLLPFNSTLEGNQAIDEVLTVSFPARKIRKLWWYGDGIRSWYPTEFSVEYHRTDTNAWVKVADVTNHGAPYWEYDLGSITPQVVDQIRLTIRRVNPPGSRACILEFDATITETFEGDQILRLALLEELEADTGTLPIGNVSANEIELALDNSDGRWFPGNKASPYAGMLRPNRRIRPFLGPVLQDGTVEWVPLGVFWSGDWSAPSDEVAASTRGHDRLMFLDQSTFSQSLVYQNVSLYDLARTVLLDAGLADTEFLVDAALQSVIIPYAWFEPISHREALRLIAEAGLAVVYVDRDGLLRVTTFAALSGGPAVTALNDLDHIFSTDNPQQVSRVVNTVEVEARPLKVGAAKVIYEQINAVTVPAGGSVTLTVTYSESPAINVQAPVLSGATNTVVQSFSAYAWGATVTLRNPGVSPENVTFTITGTPLVESGRLVARAQDATRVADEGIIRPRTVSNHLIQSQALAQQIADQLLATWTNAAKDVTSRYRGNPAIEIGDRITWQDNRAKVTGDHIVIRHRLEYTGGLSGEIVGRRVN